MPGDSGVTWMLVCALPLPLHTRPWAHRAPGIPCALNSERAGIKSKTRGVCAGEIAKVCLAVIARSTLVRRSPPSGEGGCDEAIHLSACSAMDCFAYARNDGLMRDHLDLPVDAVDDVERALVHLALVLGDGAVFAFGQDHAWEGADRFLDDVAARRNHRPGGIGQRLAALVADELQRNDRRAVGDDDVGQLAGADADIRAHH